MAQEPHPLSFLIIHNTHERTWCCIPYLHSPFKDYFQNK